MDASRDGRAPRRAPIVRSSLGTSLKSSGLRVMDRRAAASTSAYWASLSMRNRTADWPRMNENSPIWARPAATTRAVSAGRRSRRGRDRAARPLPTTATVGGAGPRRSGRRQRGQDQQEQYGGQVLEHQPADGNASVPAVEEPLVHQAPEEDDGAGDGDGEPEHDAGFARPAPPPAHTVAEGSGDRHLAQRPRYRHPAHAPQVAQREVQADAEHQEDDAQLGELADGVHVADEARGEGPDGHPGHEIADDRRHPRAPGQQPAHEGRGQGDTDVDEKRDLVHGRAPSQRFAASAAEQAASTRRSRRPMSSRRTLAPTARARDGRASGGTVHPPGRPAG